MAKKPKPMTTDISPELAKALEEMKNMSPKEREEFRKKMFPKPLPFNPKALEEKKFKPTPLKDSRGRKAMRGAD
tara:strand:- start:507 stop:728 length:222 start_codon:yes stop_codon:yes gene_type:complete